ncbi:hypothetical protein V5F49_11300 [Xanthobacter sp. V3C-3]|uniref:putative barnase/colicin E5 family endoribonuclease n=1 Tax=Xanthobacter lutulentifluminis TaxID=3119935 RepID=UPI003726EA9B
MTVFFGNEADFPAGATLWEPSAPPVADDFIRDVMVTAEAFGAAQEAQRFVGNTFSATTAMETAIDRRNDAIRAATGVALDNPLRASIDRREAFARMRAKGIPGLSDPNDMVRATFTENVQAYEERLARLAEERQGDGAAMAAIRPGVSVEDDARNVARAAELRAGEAIAAPSSRPWLKYGGSIAGTMMGWIRDPANVAQLFLGAGGGSAATTVGGAVVRTALREAVVNAAGEALVQPTVQKWRAELGLEAGLGEAAKNVAMAGAFGGLIGGVAGGIGHALRPDAPVIARALAGDDEALIAAARDSGDPVLRAGADAMEADNLARGAPPAWADPAEHGADFAQAMRFAEDPEAFEPPAPTYLFAWHGSPHQFDRFDVASIGRGEGTQHEGHGLYFAEREGVARWYQEAYKAPVIAHADGTLVPLDNGDLPSSVRNTLGDIIAKGDDPPAQVKRLFGANLRHAEKQLERQRHWAEVGNEAAQAKVAELEREIGAFQHAIALLDEGGADITLTTRSHLYDARITRRPDEFLDLNASLADQSDHVKEALAKLGYNADDPVAAARSGDDIRGDFYADFDPAEVAARLRAAGIAGTKYFDGRSKVALGLDANAAAARNFVVFDDADIRILSRDGVSLLADLPAGASYAGRGDFGPVISGFELSEGARWRAAADYLMKAQDGEVPGALWHPDIGPIDLVWGFWNGSNGMGLAKIVGKHPEVLDRLGEVVAQGEVVSESANRVRLASDEGRAVIRLEFDGTRKKWLMTAYDPRAGGRTESPGGLQAGSHSSPASRADDTIAAAAPVEKPRGILEAYPLGDDATGGARMVTSDALRAAGARDGELAAITRACNT